MLLFLLEDVSKSKFQIWLFQFGLTLDLGNWYWLEFGTLRFIDWALTKTSELINWMIDLSEKNWVHGLN